MLLLPHIKLHYTFVLRNTNLIEMKSGAGNVTTRRWNKWNLVMESWRWRQRGNATNEIVCWELGFATNTWNLSLANCRWYQWQVCFAIVCYKLHWNKFWHRQPQHWNKWNPGSKPNAWTLLFNNAALQHMETRLCLTTWNWGKWNPVQTICHWRTWKSNVGTTSLNHSQSGVVFMLSVDISLLSNNNRMLWMCETGWGAGEGEGHRWSRLAWEQTQPGTGKLALKNVNGRIGNSWQQKSGVDKSLLEQNQSGVDWYTPGADRPPLKQQSPCCWQSFIATNAH